MDPLSAGILAGGAALSGVGSAYAGSQKRKGDIKVAKIGAKQADKSSKRAAHETKRQTLASILEGALNRQMKASEGKRASQNDLTKSQVALIQDIASGVRQSSSRRG